MHVLVFEFITGGGFSQQALPESLLKEGQLMRNALLDDLCELEIELLVLQDERISIESVKQGQCLQYLTIDSDTDLQVFLNSRQTAYDVVWLIAPETDGILASWCHFFSQQGKKLATSTQQVVELCQDKFRTVSVLQKAGVPCVPACLLDPSDVINHTKARTYYKIFHANKAETLLSSCSKDTIQINRNILKINDSVGCDEIYLIESEQHWQNILPKLRHDKQYIIQPYIPGKVLSLSCLFYLGNAYFICCNEQQMKIENQQFDLLSCTVNVQPEKFQIYQKLCQQIADIMPNLFGYAGIDFIQTDADDHLLLEVNPRLTSSYAGIRGALGINVARLVLGMLNHQHPTVIKTNLFKINNQQMLIDIHQGKVHAG